METLEILTGSGKETKKIGEILGQQILSYRHPMSIIISLEGELGSGKTTFTQGFAKGLGIKENPRSPTFVIMQIYKFKKRSFIHIDAYRVKSKDLKILGWRALIKNPENLILIEWGNKIKNILPKNSLRIIFKHVGHPEHRLIKICK